MKTLPHIPIFVLTLIATVIGANAQSTAFTYHGRLNDNGAPVNGAYDMQFSVYDAEDAGQLVAGPPPQNAIEVINGLFRARIDFGAGVFTGPPRWLEIQVRPAGNGNFQTLSPRQELTSSPYAIRAQTAGTAADVSNGSVVRSLNSLKDDVALAAGANVTIAPNGNTLTISSTGPGGNVWGLNGANAYYTAGKVGIGVDIPPAPLSVFSSTASALDNTAVFYAPALGANASHVHYGTTGDWYIRSASGTGKVVLQDSGGNVGIGTQTPTSKLTVATPWLTHGIEHTDGNARLSTFIDSTGGSLGTISNHRLNFYVNNNVGSPSMVINTSQYVGIGTPDPATKLHLYDASLNSTALRIETGSGVNAFARTEYANLNGQWNVGTSRGFNGDQFYIHRQGSGAIAFGVQPNGDTRVQGTLTCSVLTITGGADLAEPFQMSEDEIPKGSVVVIDDLNPGHLKLSTEAYDTRVAGIVSGANGIKPGISLHQEGMIEGGENVSLSGRVYVQADATFGAIKPGDLLTTSATAGHAMKVSDHSKAQGAILGKAMSSLHEGKGMVLVLVTLQ
ncbi:MAG: hypothetical protein KJ070_03990 [Verrucomicrobia bacterium]|nr:hypothetical protein [Verrucomicrobiota bacterium]